MNTFTVNASNSALGVPKSVTLRAVNPAARGIVQDYYILMGAIGRRLQGEVARRVGNYNINWSIANILDRTEGTLQMRNYGDDRHAHTEHLVLRDVNNDSIFEIFERATANGSNPDLSPYEVEWSYTIIPTTIDIGHSKLYTNTKGYEGLLIHGDGLECGVVAITLGVMDRDREKYKNFWKNKKSNHKSFDDLYAENYDVFGTDWMTVHQLLNTVSYLKEYRIVILYPTERNFNERSSEGFNYELNNDIKLDKTIYIFHDIIKQHYVYVQFPKRFLSTKSDSRAFCHKCLCVFNPRNSQCGCGEDSVKKKYYEPKRIICNECGESYVKSSTKHKCGQYECKSCSLFHNNPTTSTDYLKQRCPITISGEKMRRKFSFEEESFEELEANNFDMEEKQKYDLWVWDIESCMVAVEGFAQDYMSDDNGNFITTEDGDTIVYNIEKSMQVPNFIAAKNVGTGEEFQWTSITDFIHAMLQNNDGYNIMLAHNSSGYDSRLVFEEVTRMNDTGSIPRRKGSSDFIVPTMNGTRIMHMKVGNIIFQDTMCHLKGSLKSLAKGFNLEIEKGHFPHLFNKTINYDYIGPIPERKYFDLSFSLGTDKDLDEFNEWYSEWEGRDDWCFKDELEKYCINDVEVLARIVQLNHKQMIDLLSEKYKHLTISPWFFPTTAGHVHAAFIHNEHMGKKLDEMDAEEVQVYAQTTWCALEAEEQYFAVLGLRGGRTDIRKYYHKGPIHYKDIQSHYPHVQLKQENMYPVGTPDIHIFDDDYYPCRKHFAQPNLICGCPLDTRIWAVNKKLIIHQHEDNDGIEFVKTFFGICMVDVTPPKNLYHPVLIHFDKKKFKCIASLEPIIKEVFTSVELQRAIEMGYVVTKVYRADAYKFAKPKWTGLLGDIYVAKMMYSSNPPPPEVQVRMKEKFMRKYDIDLGDMNTWRKNPVLKMTAKQPVTSAWGKHAESVDHPFVVITQDDSVRNFAFFDGITSNQHKVREVIEMGKSTAWKVEESRKMKRPNLHKGYLPAAVFVPSYGRLFLWEEMNKLGKRVLMHDTDSIIYTEEGGDYDIEEGDCLGDWETEDFEKDNGGITEFVAIGPKSYGLRAANGKEFFKCKGVSLKRATKELLNFDVAKELLDFPEDIDVNIPQMSFVYNVGEGIHTKKFLKRVRFNPQHVKGVYKKEEYMNYPYGYEE
jgi:hypothetical protein